MPEMLNGRKALVTGGAGGIPTPLEHEVWADRLAEYEAYLLER
jgi:hypothetical protein